MTEWLAAATIASSLLGLFTLAALYVTGTWGPAITLTLLTALLTAAIYWIWKRSQRAGV